MATIQDIITSALRGIPGVQLLEAARGITKEEQTGGELLEAARGFQMRKATTQLPEIVSRTFDRGREQFERLRGQIKSKELQKKIEPVKQFAQPGFGIIEEVPLATRRVQAERNQLANFILQEKRDIATEFINQNRDNPEFAGVVNEFDKNPQAGLESLVLKAIDEAETIGLSTAINRLITNLGLAGLQLAKGGAEIIGAQEAQKAIEETQRDILERRKRRERGLSAAQIRSVERIGTAGEILEFGVIFLLLRRAKIGGLRKSIQELEQRLARNKADAVAAGKLARTRAELSALEGGFVESLLPEVSPSLQASGLVNLRKELATTEPDLQRFIVNLGFDAATEVALFGLLKGGARAFGGPIKQDLIIAFDKLNTKFGSEKIRDVFGEFELDIRPRLGAGPLPPFRRKPRKKIEDIIEDAKPVKKIPKELEPLAKQARKFKTAEEFLKSKKISPDRTKPVRPLFRETSPEGTLDILGGRQKFEGRFFDENIDLALGQGKNKGVIIKLTDDRNIVRRTKKGGTERLVSNIERENVESVIFPEALRKTPEGKKFIFSLRQNDFDVVGAKKVDAGATRRREVFLEAKNKKFQTRQELTDFFKQAKGIEAPKVLEAPAAPTPKNIEEGTAVPVGEKKPGTQDAPTPPTQRDSPLPQSERPVTDKPYRELPKAEQIKLDFGVDEVSPKAQEQLDLIVKNQEGDKSLPSIDEIEELNTRKIKQTQEFKEFAEFAEKMQRDIRPPIYQRHATMTMERVAEFLDGGIGGPTFRAMVDPVYEAAEKVARELNQNKLKIQTFNILEGSRVDRDTSLFAQGKIKDAPQNAKDLAKFSRDIYDDLLERMNKERALLGVEPIPKRKDYVTHLNELNVLSELFGGMERVTVNKRISKLKGQFLDADPKLTDTAAFQRAKRQVEGLTGLAQYVDAKQPIFNFAKKRLAEYESDPSIIRSLAAYMPSATRYIHQAQNVAKNKAFKDVLPANASQFARLWNSEQVAGRSPALFLSPQGKRAVSALRGTLGANTILGNMATTIMQLTSWPQVIAHAGLRNTIQGLGVRIGSYLSDGVGKFQTSRTKALRNLDVDIGLGDSFIDQLFIKVGKFDSAREGAAKSRAAIDVGRELAKWIMETADQFTVGASYEAFYIKAIKDGVVPEEAALYADIMTGKTQANYFKEALPPFLNTTEGKVIGQFGTFGMNQWEFFKRDFGRDFKLNEQSPKSVRTFFNQFLKFLTAAYFVDMIAEETFGRQPYDLKQLIDEIVLSVQGESTLLDVADTARDTATGYIPFLSSVKFGSMPPVLEIGSDTITAIFADGKRREKAARTFRDKWAFNILMPYGGNQLRKSLQGIEAITPEIDIPFVRDVTKTPSGKEKFNVQGTLEKFKAVLFNPYSTEAARDFFNQRDQRLRIKNQFNISGSVTSDENIEKLGQMTASQREIYTRDFAEKTKKTIESKLQRAGVGRQQQGLSQDRRQQFDSLTTEQKRQFIRRMVERGLERGLTREQIRRQLPQ